MKGVPEELEEKALKVCGNAVAVHDLVDGAHRQRRQFRSTMGVVVRRGELEDDSEEPGAPFNRF